MAARGTSYWMSRDGELLVGSGFSVQWRASEPSSETGLARTPAQSRGAGRETAERERRRHGVQSVMVVRTASKELCQ